MTEVKKREFDWISIERDYRAGVKSNKQMEREYGCTEAAIRKKAKKEGWVRDLKTSIRDLAAKKVRELEVREKFEGSSKDEFELEDTQIVEENANIQATIIISHRKDIARLRDIASNMHEELNTAVVSKEELEEFAFFLATKNTSAIEDDSEREKEFNRLMNIYMKLTALPMKAGVLDRLANTSKTLITLERQAFNIDSERDGFQTLESFLSGLD